MQKAGREGGKGKGEGRERREEKRTNVRVFQGEEDTETCHCLICWCAWAPVLRCSFHHGTAEHGKHPVCSGPFPHPE